MIARNLCNMNTATPREKSFITLCQQVVSRTIGNDQKCQQSKRRGNQLPASVVNFFESGSRSGRNQGIVLDEVEEDDGVQAQSAALQVGDQSHELRSRTMCCDGSIFFQCSLPNPLRSRMDKGFGGRASRSRHQSGYMSKIDILGFCG